MNSQSAIDSCMDDSSYPIAVNTVAIGENKKKRSFSQSQSSAQQYVENEITTMATEDDNMTEAEKNLLCAIFELGLKHSSPKVLIAFMNKHEELSTEHIKSHLQKYRIHHKRSKDEFLNYFNQNFRKPFKLWEETKGYDVNKCYDTAANQEDLSLVMQSEKFDVSSSSGPAPAAVADLATSTSINDGTTTLQLNKCHEELLRMEKLLVEWRGFYARNVADMEKCLNDISVFERLAHFGGGVDDATF